MTPYIFTLKYIFKNIKRHLVLIHSLILLLSSCQNSKAKINGVSFVAGPHHIDATHVTPILSINANAAAVMPFGFMKSIDTPEIIHNTDRQWFGETKAGTKQYITELQKAGIQIMIKPQIWVWNGEFTGTINMTTEENWQTLEKSYTNFIMTYVDLAIEMRAELFCIGTELEIFIKHRPNYWNLLIKDIRKKYKGKLTYASNWDELWHTPFWTQLDYIGVDAYFPVSDMKTPSIEDCLKNWKKHVDALSKFSKAKQRKILFTEFGYRSVDYAAEKPWHYSNREATPNMQAQINTTTALFEAVWDKDWYAGGYLWKWFANHQSVGGLNDNQFTPQNKPVAQVFRDYYKKYSSN